jgi:hypothetical protein
VYYTIKNIQVGFDNCLTIESLILFKLKINITLVKKFKNYITTKLRQWYKANASSYTSQYALDNAIEKEYISLVKDLKSLGKYQSLFGVCKPLNPLSIINVEHALATPIKSLLQMVLGQRQLERKVNSSENRIRVLEEKLILSEMNSESLKNNLSKMIRVAEVVKKFQRRKMSDENSFMEMLSSFFDSWKFVHSFSGDGNNIFSNENNSLNKPIIEEVSDNERPSSNEV